VALAAVSRGSRSGQRNRGPCRRVPLVLLLGFCAALGLSAAGAPVAGAAPGDTALVTSFTPSALRNDFGGWVGMRLQGGASDISVTGLGRWVVSGNSQAHPVRLVLASTGADVATATVATSGQPAGAFAFTDLSSPVTLLANTTYYLLTQEFAGGDSWYDYNTATVTTSAGSNTGVVWATTGAPSSFNAGGTTGQAYGVPNLRYTSTNAAPAITQQPGNQTVTAGDAAVFTAAASGVPTPTVQWQSKPPAGSFANIGGATSTVLTVSSTTVGMSGTEYRAVFSNSSGGPATTNAATLTVNASAPAEGTALVTYFSPSALRNDFNGWVGMRLQGGASDISVKALGRWVVAGNSQTHTVRLVNAGTGAELATASVATSGQPAGAFTYTTLGSPVTLLANTTYYLLSEEFAGGDTWYDYNTTTITTSAASDTGVVWATVANPNSFIAGGSVSQAFVVPNLRYTIVNAAPAITQQPSNQTVTAGATAVFTAAASGVPTPTVQWQSKPPAGSFANIGGATSLMLSVPSTTVGMSGTEYRAVFSNSSGGPATTNAATLTVNAAPPAEGTALVTYFTPSALRNDFGGWVGMRIQVGVSNLSVSSLGRWVVNGNSQAHPVRLVTTTGTEVATATVATSGQPAGAFAFTALGAPVTLSANTTYYLLSQEFASGDTWYDYNTATITTSAAGDTGVVWATNGAPNTFNAGGSAGQSYGVPNMRYTVLNSAPTDIALTVSSVAENLASGTTVGTLSTTDIDAGDTHAYTLVAGAGSTDNGSFQITGTALQTAASFDFETKNSYAIRVRSSDSGSPSLNFEKQFTITVTNVNDAPTDIALTASSVPENSAVNTVVGTLSSTDQDTGQTYSYTLVAGAGSTDNGSFNISGTSLRTSASFNFEVKSSYSVRVRVTDNGAPNLNFEEAFTITVTDVNDAPVTVNDSYSGAIGNTLFVLNTGGSGPKKVVTGSVIIANDTDEDATFPHTLSAVAETVASTGGGSATITTDGNFTFIPGVGDESQNDTFNYKVTDGSLQTTGTVTVTIGADRAWYVDNALGVNGDGRSTSPFNNLLAVNNGADPDGDGDYIFLYEGSGSYTGGIALEVNQRLSGQPEGFTVGADTVLAASGSRPSITNTAPSGPGITLANNTTIRAVVVTGTAAAGITGSSITTADIGANVLIQSSTGAAFSLLNAAGGNITMAANITHSSASGRSIFVTARTSGTVTISGAINDTAGGIQLTNNTGATINFTGGMTVSAGINQAFTATGGGTVNVTGTNTLTGQLGLEVQNTTIGVSGLTFQSINSSGGTNGLLLNATGSTGGLTVTGTGAGGSGGTIQSKSGAGISLTTVGGAVSLTNMNTQTVSGADVLVNGGGANVTFTGTITNTAGRSVDVSNKTGGTVLFSGAINDSGSGISLTSNSGTTNFTGVLTLATTTNAAFTATSSGTVNAANAANTIITTTGTALNVASTTIGANGLVFTSIAAGTGASGPTNAIILNNTGTTAGLTVNGTGTTDGSGGHIQRTTGDAISLTNTRFTTLKNMTIGDSTATAGQTPNATNHIAGDGIDMNDANDVTLNNIRIARTGNHGIDGTGVTNLSMVNSEIYNAGDANGDSAFAFNDFGSNQTNLEGTVTITNVVFDGMAENGVDIENFGGTLNMTVSGSRFANNTSTLCGGTCGENGLLTRADGTSVINLTVNNNGGTKTLFDGIDGNGLYFISEGTSATASTLNVTQTTIQNSKAIGMVIWGGTGDHTSTIQSRLNFTVGGAAGSGVSITGSNATAVSIQPNGKSIVRGTFSHVTVTGSTVGRGIEVLSDDVSTAVIDINNNTISNTAFNGIFANNGDSGVLDIHIRNNNVSAPLDAVPASGLAVHGIEINPLAEASTTCLDIASNVSAGNAASGGAGYRTRQRDPAVFKIERLTLGTVTSSATVVTFLQAQNTSGTGSATVGAVGYTGVADGACADV
jgi:hypothetical protein